LVQTPLPACGIEFFGDFRSELDVGLRKASPAQSGQLSVDICRVVNKYCLSIKMDKMTITKVGLAVLDHDRLLLVRKRGGNFYILPGGKPELGENDFDTLSREIWEELGCGLAVERLVFLGAFFDEAAGMPGVKVTIRLYAGQLIGSPAPQAEIEDLKWWARTEQNEPSLAPSLRNSILPFLCQTAPGVSPQLTRNAESFS
jgi:8-oxo-dGTP diphosphatase